MNEYDYWARGISFLDLVVNIAQLLRSIVTNRQSGITKQVLLLYEGLKTVLINLKILNTQLNKWAAGDHSDDVRSKVTKSGSELFYALDVVFGVWDKPPLSNVLEIYNPDLYNNWPKTIASEDLSAGISVKALNDDRLLKIAIRKIPEAIINVEKALKDLVDFIVKNYTPEEIGKQINFKPEEIGKQIKSKSKK